MVYCVGVKQRSSVMQEPKFISWTRHAFAPPYINELVGADFGSVTFPDTKETFDAVRLHFEDFDQYVYYGYVDGWVRLYSELAALGMPADSLMDRVIDDCTLSEQF